MLLFKLFVIFLKPFLRVLILAFSYTVIRMYMLKIIPTLYTILNKAPHRHSNILGSLRDPVSTDISISVHDRALRKTNIHSNLPINIRNNYLK